MTINSLAGLHIYPYDPWPQVEDGVEVVRYYAHPIIFWLAKWLPIDPYVDAEYIKYKDADALVDKIGGVMYCSHRQLNALKTIGYGNAAFRQSGADKT